MHPDQDLPLIYHVNLFTKNGFACAVHQISMKTMQSQHITFEDIISDNYDRKLKKPVLYFSRILNKHKHNYWSTELKIVSIV